MLSFTLAAFFIANCLNAMETSPVHLVLTTALISHAYQERKQEYITSFNQFKKLGYDHPYIVEGVQSHGPSFFHDYTDSERIYYFPDNKPSDRNKGKFEGLSLKGALAQFKFVPESYAYKQTGRYFATKNLAEIITQYPGFDLYLRRFPGLERVMLAAFIMKIRPMEKMYNSLSYEQMEQEWQASDPQKAMIENYATDYLKQTEQEKQISVFYLPSSENDFPLGILLNPAHSGTGLDSNNQTKY